MSNFIEYNDKMVFHPGYYIKEIIEESGMTQEDYAKRLDTTAKNLSLLIRGEQSLSIDMAIKLSKMMDTSIVYWLNLQQAYDALYAEAKANSSLKDEIEILKILDYKYFTKFFGLSEYRGNIEKQVETLRRFLRVSSLTVLDKDNLAVSFRMESCKLSREDRIKANAMVQVAANRALLEKRERFEKKKFESSVEDILKLTKEHKDFYETARSSFAKAGVLLIAIPNIPGSKTNGATKKIGESIMLMVNDRGTYGDSFWFTMMHEIGHIVCGDFGISLETDDSDKEKSADEYAREKLIPNEKYQKFKKNEDFSSKAIKEFAEAIDRDPGIVAGRLIHDGLVDEENKSIKMLRKKYGLYVNS